VKDIRGSQVFSIIRELEASGVEVSVFDPLVPAFQLKSMGLRCKQDPFTSAVQAPDTYDAVILAVPHRAFRETSVENYWSLLKNDSGLGVLVDLQGILSLEGHRPSEILFWTL
jgi:UDP-N-acetyl-D-galactosamine dehydrogenase